MRWKQKLEWLCGLSLLCVAMSCAGRRVPPENRPLPEGFEAFYQRFHEDSAFQMAHIAFPLPGMPGLVLEEREGLDTFRWHREAWKIHQKLDWDTISDFRRAFLPKRRDVVNEYICTLDNFCLLRRFARRKGEWFLVYYEDMNYRGWVFPPRE